MKRAVWLALASVLFVAACSDNSTTAPASDNIVFTAQLLPINETPPVTNAEATASGTVTLTFVPTKDSSGTITSAAGTADVSMLGFPAGSTITLAHIHTGAVGVNGSVLIGFVPGSSIQPANGAATFSQTANATGDQITALINNPAGFYFNVHTALNPAGAMRGQLARSR